MICRYDSIVTSQVSEPTVLPRDERRSPGLLPSTPLRPTGTFVIVTDENPIDNVIEELITRRTRESKLTESLWDPVASTSKPQGKCEVCRG